MDASEIPPTPEHSLPPALPPHAETPPQCVALLVDFDNVVSLARETGFNLSLGRLRAMPRSYGRVAFAFAFLSPSSTRPETVAGLRAAGFLSFACPLAFKNADAVDTVLIEAAKQLIDWSVVATLVVASADRDFQSLATYALDRGKRVLFLDPREHREALEGTDFMQSLPRGERVRRFETAIQRIAREVLAEPDEGGRRETEFIESVIRAVAAERSPSQPSFRDLSKYLWSCLHLSWSKWFGSENLTDAMTACVNEEVIIKSVTDVTTYYTLNLNHPAVIRTRGLAGTRNG